MAGSFVSSGSDSWMNSGPEEMPDSQEQAVLGIREHGKVQATLYTETDNALSPRYLVEIAHFLIDLLFDRLASQ